jgi:hypothetical protein
MGRSVADTRACHKKGSTSIRVAIGAKIGIRASSNKDIFGLS